MIIHDEDSILDQLDHQVKRKKRPRPTPQRTPFGERLHQAILLKYGSQATFAAVLRVTERTISRYMYGRIPGGQVIERLARAFPETIGYLLTGEEGTDRRLARMLEEMPEQARQLALEHVEVIYRATMRPRHRGGGDVFM